MWRCRQEAVECCGNFLFCFLLLLLFANASSSSELPNVCLTPGCKEISRYLRAKVDFDAKPCEDFYSFACGKLMESDKFTSTWADNKEAVEKVLINIMESPSLYGRETPIRSAKRFYERCLDVDPTEVDLQHSVVNFIKQFANWPLFSVDDHNSNFNVWDVAATLQGELSILSFFDFTIDLIAKCSADFIPNQFVPVIRPSYAAFPNAESKFYKRKQQELQNRTVPDTDSKCAANLVADFKGVFGHTDNRLNEAVEHICSFEQEMLDHLEKYARDDELSGEMFIDELDTIYQSKPIWKSYFNRIAEIDTSGKLVGWLQNNPIRVIKPSFLEHLIEKVENTSVETVGNFLLFKLIRFANDFYMNTARLGERDEMMKISLPCAQGSFENNFERRKCTCLVKTMDLFHGIAGHLFLDADTSMKAERDSAIKFTETIRQSVKAILNDSQWLSDITKVRVAIKIDHLIATVGFNTSVLNITELTDWYRHKHVHNDDDYFKIYRNFNRFRAAKLHVQFDRYNMWMPVFEANAVYDHRRNSIFLPWAVLNNHRYRSGYPPFYNFGSAGYLIGHEMFHGFAASSARFDHVGSFILTETQYLFKKSEQEYVSRIKCFMEDYSNHTYIFNDTEINIDGRKTLAENLADFDGIRAAYKAFHVAMMNQSYEPIEGFENATADQMFFTSFASNWCSNQPKFATLITTQIESNTHSPYDARVNVMLRNLPEFREAFQCRPTDFMYQNYLNGQCKFY